MSEAKLHLQDVPLQTSDNEDDFSDIEQNINDTSFQNVDMFVNVSKTYRVLLVNEIQTVEALCYFHTPRTLQIIQ